MMKLFNNCYCDDDDDDDDVVGDDICFLSSLVYLNMQLAEGVPASQAISRWKGGNGWFYLFRDVQKTVFFSSPEMSPLLSKFPMSSGIPNSSHAVQNDHPADGAGSCPVG